MSDTKKDDKWSIDEKHLDRCYTCNHIFSCICTAYDGPRAEILAAANAAGSYAQDWPFGEQPRVSELIPLPLSVLNDELCIFPIHLDGIGFCSHNCYVAATAAVKKQRAPFDRSFC